MEPDKVFKVQHDEEFQQLSDAKEGDIKYVATLQAYIESASGSDEGETEITEVRTGVNQISVRRFYGEKVKNRMSKERDMYRVRLLKRYIAKERAEKMKKNFDSSDLMSDTSTNTTGTDNSIRSNTTYSDSEHNVDTDEKQEKKNESTTNDTVMDSEQDRDVDIEMEEKEDENESERKDKEKEEKKSMPSSPSPLVGSQWSAGPSNTDSERTSTQTIITTTGPRSSDTGYLMQYNSKEKVKNETGKKLSKGERKNKQKERNNKKCKNRKVDASSGVEGDCDWGDEDGEGCL